MDFLKSAVASAISKGPLAGYTLADRVDVDNSIWSLNNATKRVSSTLLFARVIILTKSCRQGRQHKMQHLHL